MSVEYKNLLPGFCSGISRVIVSYPFDYLRLTLQTNKEKSVLVSLTKHYKQLYRGFFFPFVAIPIDRSITFYLYEKLKRLNTNEFLFCMIPSIVSNVYMTPINLINSNYIYHNKTSLSKLIAYHLNTSIYNGFIIEVARNTCSSFMFLYFYTYFTSICEYPVLNGAGSSVAMWTVLYPLDTIKAKKFIYKKSYYETFQSTALKNLYSGISLVYLRAIPSAGVGMLVYEYVKNNIKCTTYDELQS